VRSPMPSGETSSASSALNGKKQISARFSGHCIAGKHPSAPRP